MGDSNRFIIFADFIQKHFNNCEKILDVAGGQGGLTYELIKRGYQVTVIDPKIKIKNNNVSKIKKYYNDEIDISDYDLIVGLHPDGATEYIVKNAIQNNKRFAVIPCCVFPINKKLKFNYHQWINHLQQYSPNINRWQLYMQGCNIVLYN